MAKMSLQFRHLRMPEEKTIYLLCNVTKLDTMLYKALATQFPNAVSRDGHWIRVSMGKPQQEGLIEISAKTIKLEQVDDRMELAFKFRRSLSPSERVLYAMLAEALNSAYPAHIKLGESTKPCLSVALTDDDPAPKEEPSEILVMIQGLGDSRPKFDF